MSNNSSSSPWQHLPFYVLYITEGVVIGGGNLLIVITILRYAALRCSKEFVLMMGLSLADCIYMAGYMFAGIHRIRLLFLEQHDTQENGWMCMVSMHTLCFTFGLPLSAMMLVVVGTDRLCAVISPLAYIGWTVAYARWFVGSVYILNTLTAIYAYISVYFGPVVKVAATCVPATVFRLTAHELYSLYFSRSSQLYGVLSVVLFVFVAILYKRTNMIVFDEHPNQQYELKRQRKVTGTLLLSAVCTFFLYVLPFGVGIVLNERGEYMTAIIFWSMSNLNAFGNVFIYPLRHSEMRKGIWAMLRCKSMPLDLKLWNPQPTGEAGAATPRVSKYKPREARVGDQGRHKVMEAWQQNKETKM